MPLAPVNNHVTMDQLTRDPYPTYRRMRAETPVVRVTSVKRTFLTKAAFTKYVKDTPEIFSSDDPNTPMKPAFRAHTLMRKDGAEHMSERKAIMPALAPKRIRVNAVAPSYLKTPFNIGSAEKLEATAEAGQVMIDAIVEVTAKFVTGMIEGKNVAEIPPFMP